MLSLYVLFVSFSLCATALCAIFSYRIAHKNLTPTFTWMLFFTAFVLRFIGLINGVFYIRDVVDFIEQYSFTLVLVSQFLQAAVIGLFLIAICRIHAALNRNGIK